MYQLVKGGLFAQYYNNAWFYGAPVVEKIEKTIDFNWADGKITPDASDNVSVKYSGKLLVDSSGVYTLFVSADDDVELELNHVVVANYTGVAGIERRAQVYLEEGTYHDIVLSYKESTGQARLSLKYSSDFITKQVIPSSKLFSKFSIVGSPFTTSVTVDTSDYIYTTAFGDALTVSSAGNTASFLVQLKDANGNNRTSETDPQNEFDTLNIEITASATSYYPDMTYLGDGLYRISYTVLKAGNYSVNVKLGRHDVQCGMSITKKCSPYALQVSPAESSGSFSEAEGPSSSSMDTLKEAVSGESGYFFIQSKDAYGNSKQFGGDSYAVSFVSTTDSNTVYKGSVSDMLDGTYTVYYTILQAGQYYVSIGLQSRGDSVPILQCTSASAPYVYSRAYNGVDMYSAPSFCSINKTVMNVVHNRLHASSSVVIDDSSILTTAKVAAVNTFYIEAKDPFGNTRSGLNTTHFCGYGKRQVRCVRL